MPDPTLPAGPRDAARSQGVRSATDLPGRAGRDRAAVTAVMAVVAVGAVVVVGYGVWCVTTGRTSAAIGFRLIAGTDSALYVRESHRSLFSGDLYTGSGPFLYLWLLKLCGRSFRAVVLVQSLIAAGCWSRLAWSLAATLRRPALRVGAALAVMLLAVAPAVIIWNDAIATESLAISLSALATACVLDVVRAPTRRRVIVALGVAALLAVTRDTLALLVLGAGALVVPAALRRGLPRAQRVQTLAAAAVLLAVASGAMVLSSAAEPPRWYYPTWETVVLRIANQPDGDAFLAERGYPRSPEVDRLSQDLDYFFAVAVERRWTRMPEFAALAAWTRTNGRSALIEYLATHPGWVLRSAWNDRGALIDPQVTGYARVAGSLPSGPTRIGDLAYLPSGALVGLLGVLGLGAAALVTVRRRALPAQWVGLALAGFGLIHVLGAYHADSLEVDRHSIGGAVQLRIGLWIVLLCALDRLGPRPGGGEDDTDGAVP